MKYNIQNHCLAIWLFSLLLTGCTRMDNYNEIVSKDKTKPEAVTNIQTKAFNGGAEISYNLPKSDNILYVQAEYKINEQQSRQTKASYYDNKLVVEGFEDQKEYEITLTVVSRAEVKSDPVVVKVTPLEPAYKLVKQTLTAQADFGGIFTTSVNSLKKDIGIIVITKDENNEWNVIEQHFSSLDTIRFSIRGYDSIPREFGLYVIDKWNNTSDTLFKTIKPIYEYQLDKLKFQPFPLPSDKPDAFGWVMRNLWDNNVNSGFHTNVGTGMPQHFTFDLGVTSQLSRFKIWHRARYEFGHGNPKRFRVWGSPTPNSNGDFDASWTLLGEYKTPDKPSGLPVGTNTAEDISLSAAGFEFNFPLNVPEVRYIRFETLESWSGGDFMHMMEITFWGN